MFGTTATTPRNVDILIEISALTLHGRDDRYVAALVFIILGGWVAGWLGGWVSAPHQNHSPEPPHPRHSA
jgi:hypothetical protein